MAQPSTATVTFLFTDIEGSTRRWENFPEAMAQAVQRHDTLMREVIARHGGMVFKTIGDAFCAAFPDALEALNATVEAQRAIQAEEWGEVAPLRVRMGLHTGAAQTRDNDFFGPTVNRVARLMSIGHGGQILLSGSTRGLVVDRMPPDLGWTDLGEHRLKDLSRAEHVWQIVAPDLQAEFPAVRSLNRREHNLPVHPTSLIGRDEEVRAVVALLRQPETRLVTLSGPGGTGKSRLALQVGAECLDDFQDGVFFVALAAATEAAGVITAIAETLNCKETAGETLLASLTQSLREKRLLLILDNFEQVTSAAPVLSDLMAAAAGVKMLVTSRIVLRLRGEREFPVPTLGSPSLKAKLSPEEALGFPSVALFVERAQASRPDFAITADNVAAVTEICRRLDGLPLAIELAAARIKMLAPSAMLGYLKSRLKLLTGGARDLPERQRTLRNAIAWSYDLLTAEEQSLLRHLSVFPGGCSFLSAEAVAQAPDGPELDVFEGLASLVDKSLLRQSERAGEESFVMLETIREFSGEKLAAAGEESGAMDRFAAFYRDQILGEPEDSTTWDQEGEELNARAALDHMLAHGDAASAAAVTGAMASWWERRGLFTEWRGYAQRCLGRESEISDRALVAELLRTLGWFAHLQGEDEDANRLEERSLALYRAIPDAVGEATALNNLALIAQARGDAVLAKELFEESLAVVRALGDGAREASRLSNLGILASEQGEFDVAASRLFEAAERYASLGDRNGTAACWCNLGDLELRRGDFERAIEFSGKSLGLFRELGDRRGIAIGLANMAVAHQGRGEPALAGQLAREADAIARECGMTWLSELLAETLQNTG